MLGHSHLSEQLMVDQQGLQPFKKYNKNSVHYLFVDFLFFIFITQHSYKGTLVHQHCMHFVPILLFL